MAILAEKIKIQIDGKTYNEYTFSEIQLIQELQSPNKLRFLMHKKDVIENENDIRFSLSEELLGKNVDYFLSTLRDHENGKTYTDALEFSGIVFNVNVLRKNLKAGMVIEIIAYSPDYLLFDNPHCCSYENETLKNMVAKTLEPYKISIQNNPRMEEEIPYTVQYNETNYAFLSRLALRFGQWLYYNGKELVFGKIIKSNDPGNPFRTGIEEVDHVVQKFDDTDSGSDTLHLGYDVVNYQYRLDLEHLNFTHAHHNYLDYGNTKNDGYNFTENDMHNLTDVAYNYSKSLYSKETFQHLKVSSPEDGFDETEHSAQTQGLGKKAQMMVCQGSSNRADLRIGSVFKIKEYYDKGNNEKGTCYHDELLICKISHVTDSNGNYENHFTAIPATCEYPPYAYGDHYPKAQTQRAVVIDNQDPEKLGRVRVQFLWQKEQDDNMITPWIRIAQPHGGDNKGFYFIPEIDEEVMVGFENGNAEKPYVTGTLYHGNQHPEEKWYSDSNDVKAFRSRNGHTVEIKDIEEGGFIRIYDNEKDNYILTFSTDDKLIKLESSGNIELMAESDILMEAGGSIKMTANADISRNAEGNISDTAEKDCYIRSGENMGIGAGNDMDTNVGNNQTIYVSSNQFIEIKANKNETISEKCQITAETIRQEATDKMLIYSKNHEQKSENKMKFDGGKGLDLFAKNIKMN